MTPVNDLTWFQYETRRVRDVQGEATLRPRSPWHSPHIAGLAMGPAGDTLADLLGRFWAEGAAERVEF